MKILDLGCGKKKQKGAMGIDINPDTDADIIHDLNKFPYPFEDSTFDFIYADNVIEHLDNVVKVLEELYRITKGGATIKIIVPFFRSVYASIDPTHKHFFTVRSLDYFATNKPFYNSYKYSRCSFEIKKVIFDENLSHSLLGELMKKFANRYPVFYENRIAIILPLSTITYYLETSKLT